MICMINSSVHNVRGDFFIEKYEDVAYAECTKDIMILYLHIWNEKNYSKKLRTCASQK
jgi:hypothetical protein